MQTASFSSYLCLPFLWYVQCADDTETLASPGITWSLPDLSYCFLIWNHCGSILDGIGVGGKGPSGPELPSVSAKLVSSFLPSFGKTSLLALKKCDLCSNLVNSGRGKLSCCLSLFLLGVLGVGRWFLFTSCQGNPKIFCCF